MKRLYLLMALALCAFAIPASAQFGPFPNAGTGSNQPADLCKNFPNNTCIIAKAQNESNQPLDQYDIQQNGVDTFTNSSNTPGWIVIISGVGDTTLVQAIPGTFNGHTCQAFTPGDADIFTDTAYGSQRNFYQVIFTGSCTS